MVCCAIRTFIFVKVQGSPSSVNSIPNNQGLRLKEKVNDDKHSSIYIICYIIRFMNFY